MLTAVPPVLGWTFRTPHAPNQSGRGGRTATTKFYAVRDNLGALAAEISEHGGYAVAIDADLRAADEPARLAEAAEAAVGPLDVLVCAAGVAPIQSLTEVSAEDFDETLAVNLRAPFLLAQRVLPGMSERRFGRILFVSSVAALTGGIVGPHYAASKAGQHALTHFLASRFADRGVTVNALAPALITDTIMLPDEPEVLKQLIPVGLLGRPEEVADLALAVLRNGYLTNKVLVLDGGILAR